MLGKKRLIQDRKWRVLITNIIDQSFIGLFPLPHARMYLIKKAFHSQFCCLISIKYIFYNFILISIQKKQRQKCIEKLYKLLKSLKNYQHLQLNLYQFCQNSLIREELNNNYNLYKHILLNLLQKNMFDYDIFLELDSNTALSPAQNKMSSQLYSSISGYFETYPTTHRPLNPEIDDTKQVQNEVQFEDVEFFSSSLKYDSEDFLAGDQEANVLNQGILEKDEQSNNQTQKRSGSTNNIANYIIKHSLKKMLSAEVQEQITLYCIDQGVTYEEFFGYWSEQLHNKIQKHIGVNLFRKLIKPKTPFVEVCKCFMTVYLKLGYPLYIMASSIGDKMAYFKCAVDLLYMAKVSKRKSYKLFLQAQNGLDQ